MARRTSKKRNLRRRTRASFRHGKQHPVVTGILATAAGLAGYFATAGISASMRKEGASDSEKYVPPAIAAAITAGIAILGISRHPIIGAAATGGAGFATLGSLVGSNLIKPVAGTFSEKVVNLMYPGGARLAGPAELEWDMVPALPDSTIVSGPQDPLAGEPYLMAAVEPTIAGNQDPLK